MGADGRRFEAMGSTALVIVVDGDAGALDRAERRIAVLEARWSRFLDDSEIAELNRLPGVPVVLSDDTYLLVRRAVDGWRATAGRFDPTVLAAVEALGYDRTFADVVREDARRLPAAERAPGCAHMVLDDVVRSVTLPRGVRFDPGGIGKGLAADLVVDELLDDGAAGALVSIGGDLRVRGVAPGGTPWSIAVEDPEDPAVHLATFEVADAGIATTTSARRWWTRDGHAVHHVIDPALGLPADGPRAVTVAAPDAATAEVLAKSAMVAGAAATGVLRDAGVAGVVVRDGEVETVEPACDPAREQAA
jgi:thiamine biosynthesis lipoprotein